MFSKIVIVSWVCDRDVDLIPIHFAAIRKLDPACHVYYVFDKDDTKIPKAFDENTFIMRSTFPRNGNLNGAACVYGMVDFYSMLGVRYGNIPILKVDADTVLTGLSWVNDILTGTVDFIGGHSSNGYYVSGCCYALSAYSSLRIKSYLENAGNIQPSSSYHMPEDQVITMLAAVTGNKVKILENSKDSTYLIPFMDYISGPAGIDIIRRNYRCYTLRPISENTTVDKFRSRQDYYNQERYGYLYEIFVRARYYCRVQRYPVTFKIIPHMKFDCIIMNPPYKRNLHLKILAEAIKHLNDEDSKVVNLSPIRWLEDPLASYKKNNDYHRFEDSVGKHIEDVDGITDRDASISFNARININLGLYRCSSGEFAVYQELSKNSIFNKVIPYLINHNPVFEKNKQEGLRVRIVDISSAGRSGDGRKPILKSLGKLICFKDGKHKDGRWWYDCYKRNQCTKTTPYITNSILFENEENADNFIKQFDTYFARYLTDRILCDVHITKEKVLWMADAVNPRTGKKGYESDWTDEDFCKFFNIIEEEFAEIIKQVTRYDKK